MKSNEVPADFPRDFEELYERYSQCLSISLHLATYCLEVLRRQPNVPRDRLLAHVGFELEKRAHDDGWNMTEAEHAWILQKVKDTLDE